MGNQNNQESGKLKDRWDKFDILSKFAATVLLAIITIMIKSSADKISTSLQTGELVKNLIEDLSKTDSKMNQNLAIITLNRTIGKQNQRLMVDIAERMVYDHIDNASIYDDKHLILENFKISIAVIAENTTPVDLEKRINQYYTRITPRIDSEGSLLNLINILERYVPINEAQTKSLFKTVETLKRAREKRLGAWNGDWGLSLNKQSNLWAGKMLLEADESGEVYGSFNFNRPTGYMGTPLKLDS